MPSRHWHIHIMAGVTQKHLPPNTVHTSLCCFVVHACLCLLPFPMGEPLLGRVGSHRAAPCRACWEVRAAGAAGGMYGVNACRRPFSPVSPSLREQSYLWPGPCCPALAFPCTHGFASRNISALISSAEVSSFLARSGRGMAASSKGPQRLVQDERRHVGAPRPSPGIHTTSSFRTVKCLAKVKCSQDVWSHTEQQSPGSEANCWPCPKGPAPFPAQCPCWDVPGRTGV